MRTLFFFLLLCVGYAPLSAQQPICMTYDNAGNRTQRLVCGSGIIVPGGDDAVEAAKTQDEAFAEWTAPAALVTGQIVPNPNDGRFDIALSRAVDGGGFEMYSAQGELLLQQSAQGERNTFYLRDLPPGNYYLVLKSAGQVLGQWIVLKN